MEIKFFWSDSVKGFFNSEVHKNNIPSDAIEITEQEWHDLLEANSKHGKVIGVDEGKVVAMDPPPRSADELRDVCKRIAKRLLDETDFTQYADTASILANKEEFDVYRSKVRAYAIRPIPNPVWPTKPSAVWKI